LAKKNFQLHAWPAEIFGVKIPNLKKSLQDMLSMQGTDVRTVRARQELMHALSVRIMGTDAHAQHAHEKLNYA
jgi:hypothetical protein